MMRSLPDRFGEDRRRTRTSPAKVIASSGLALGMRVVGGEVMEIVVLAGMRSGVGVLLLGGIAYSMEGLGGEVMGGEVLGDAASVVTIHTVLLNASNSGTAMHMPGILLLRRGG